MKFFGADSAGDKDGKEKKMTLSLRRQTLSGTQIAFVDKQKRRSYGGPFPDSKAKGQEQATKDETSAFDAMSPNFIFLQFYHSSWFGEEETPLALPEEEVSVLGLVYC